MTDNFSLNLNPRTYEEKYEGNLDYIYVLDGNNCARPEEDTNKEINVDAPVLPSLNPDNMIKLDFDKINGTYKVYKIDTTLNNYGGSGQGSKIVVKAI